MMTLVATSAWAGSFESSAPKTWSFGPPAESEEAPQAASGPKAVAYSASFILNLGASSSGACPDGYADQCESGSCTCLEFTGTGKGTTFGTASSVDMELTVDDLDQPGDPDGVCFPAFGEVFFAGTKETEVVDIVGALCENFATTTVSTFAGGFEFAERSSPNYDAVGAIAAGRFTSSTKFVLKLVGKACRGSTLCGD